MRSVPQIAVIMRLFAGLADAGGKDRCARQNSPNCPENQIPYLIPGKLLSYFSGFPSLTGCLWDCAIRGKMFVQSRQW